MRRRVRQLLSIAVIVTLSAAAGGDTGTTLGDRSGEGSTPFTSLAHSPEANLFSGSLTTKIPIKVPPGRKGMTPNLALQYSSSAGASIYGYGWNLPIGRINRSTKWGVPRCTGDHTDDFVILLPGGGSMELVRTTGDVFRPVVESTFLEATFDESANVWTVRDRAGIRYTFGDERNAKVSSYPDGPALQQNPDGSCDLTSSWMLTRSQDTHGNSIEIEWDNIGYPQPRNIYYGGNDNGIDHIYRLYFSYGSRLTYPTSYELGVAQTMTNVLSSIQVYADAPQTGQVVRTYSFSHNLDTDDDAKLTSVSATGEPTQTFAYTPQAVGHEPSGQAVSITVPAGFDYLRQWTGSLEATRSIIDMNGDGKLDLVYGLAFPWTVHFGISDGSETFSFDPTPVSWTGSNQAPGFGRIRNVWVTSGPCDENGWACTVADTFDITGDGRVDYIWADDPSQPWQVFPGELKANGVWGFADQPILWPAPDQFIRKAKDGHTYRDTIDVNGDGLPDLIDVDNGNWSVWLSTGLGFESTPLPNFPAPVGSIAHSTGGSNSRTDHMLSDFDGDGLADMLVFEAGPDGPLDCYGFEWSPSLSQYINVNDCLLMYRNTGQGFSDQPVNSPLPRWVDGLTQVAANEVIADLVDINGDGLPDWVGRADNGVDWNFFLNTGGRLSSGTYETTPPYDYVATEIWPGGEGPIRENQGNNTLTDLVDLNGDGLLDRVTTGSTVWSVQLNAAKQRPHLLSMMENGLGGTNTIVYDPTSRFDHTGGDGEPDLPFTTWVVAGTRLNDGLCAPAPGANVFDPSENPCIDLGHEKITFYDYQDGRLETEYEYDGSGNPIDLVDRGFYGFRRVTRTDIDGNETASVFGQSALVRGRVLEVHYFGGDSQTGRLVRWEGNLWASSPMGPDRDQVWLRRNATLVHDLGGVPLLTINENHAVDTRGNVLHTTVGGNSLAAIETFVTYATPFGSNDCFPYDKPSTVVTLENGVVIDSRRFTYDNAIQGTLSAGNLTKIESWLDTESTWVAVENEYDAYGNLVLTRNPNGAETTYDYDDGLGTFLYPVVETNPLAHQSVTLIDYLHGKPAVTWGANGAATATTYIYDPAGRLTCEARPGDSPSSCTIETTYTFAANPGEHSTVRIERKQSGYATGRVTTTFLDALGRERYSETRSVVGASVTTVRRNQVDFDAAGRVHKRYYPYPASQPSPTNGATVFDYHLNGSSFVDPLGRVFETQHADGTATRVEYYGERVSSYDEIGERTDRVLDAKGRVVLEEVYLAGSVYSSKETEYDGFGRVLALYENDHTVPTKAYTYDTLGRRTTAVDRDSGVWTMGYDHTGNLLYRDDPKANQHVQHCYDAGDRPVRTCAVAQDFQSLFACVQTCNSADVRYTYDDPSVPHSIGRLTGVTDEAGAFRVLEYDTRGRQLITERDVDANGEVTTARFEYEYNDTDEVVLVRYPDGEEVTTTFDEAGQPVSLQNDTGTVYVSAAHYDVLGRATGVWHGNGTRDDRSYYDAAANRHRLWALSTVLPNTQSTLLLYQYTPRGQIASIGDNVGGEISNTASYAYDHLGRLIDFDSTYDPIDRTYAYDTWGNLTQKGALTLTYGNPTAANVAPHHIATAGGQSLLYDANGNRTNASNGQSYAYNARDRLATITMPTATIDFLYDHDGMRRARILDGGNGIEVTRYYNDLLHTQADGKAIKSYFFGGVRVATRSSNDTSWEMAAAGGGLIEIASAWHGRPVLFVQIDPAVQNIALLGTALLLFAILVTPGGRRPRRVVGMRVGRAQASLIALVFTVSILPWPVVIQPASAQCGAPTPTPGTGEEVSHLHIDHLGSVQTITDENGDVVEKIRYMPYGEVRGRWDGSGNPLGAPSSEDVRFGFTGHEEEVSSGLIYAGARFYDPILGSFLSIDPAGEFTNPYSYVGWDPINGSDPTGECELICFALISFAIGFAIGAIDAAINGADFTEALEAGLISGATSALGSILGPAGPGLGGLDGWARGVAGAVSLVSDAYGLYTTVEAFRNGEFLAGSRGALQVLSAAIGGLSNSNVGVGAKPVELADFASFAQQAPPSESGGARISTLLGTFPTAPSSGTVANVGVSSVTIFGIKIEVGTAWAIDSAGNKQIFDVFSVGFESEVFEINAIQGISRTDASVVGDLGGTSTTIGGSGGPSPIGFGAEYNIGNTYSGVTVYGGAQYGIAPVGAYGLRETWTPRGE